MSGIDWRDVVSTVDAFWRDHWYQVVLGAATAAVLLIVVFHVAGRIARVARGASGTAKLTIGTAIVQAGVTWAVVTGTYVACTRILHVDRWESVAFAVFFEAATWVSIGMIRAHGKSGEPGFGPAGPFFWVFTACGGLLAVVGADTGGAKVGRTLVVVIGACLWYLTLLRWIKRSDKPGVWRWTPRRLLVALGAIEPGDHDVADENREWQVRRLARAMRWANSSWPWSWLGERALIRRGEATQEAVIAEARRRYAVTHLLATSCKPTSDVMQRVLADVKADLGIVADSTSDADTADVPETPVPAAKPRRTGTPRRTSTGTRVNRRTGTPPGTRTDDELLTALKDVPRELDGTVPVRRAASALGTGPDRARRLLTTAGLLRTEPDAAPANGHAVPELIDA